MRNTQTPGHVNLGTLLGWLQEGRFVVPDFQREFEWQPGDIRDLMRSIFRDYYIGSLLLWRSREDHFESLDCQPLFARPVQPSPRFIVLDGQQRLTSINYAVFQPEVSLRRRANPYVYFVRLDKWAAGDHEAAFDYDRLTKRWRKTLSDPQAQWVEHVFPLRLLGSAFEALGWLNGYRQHWAGAAAAARDAGEFESAAEADAAVLGADAFAKELEGVLQQYQVSYIELDQAMDVAKVCDIFTQINSKGVRLDVFDLMNALLKPKGVQLKHMWRQAEERLDFAGTDKMNVYVLQVMSLLEQGYCSPQFLYYLLPGNPRPVRGEGGAIERRVAVADAAGFVGRWNRAVDLLDEALKVLAHPQEYGVTASRYLPYSSIVPAFASIRGLAMARPPAERLSAQRKLRKWYWASVFTNRYSGSVESNAARDIGDLTRWYADDDAEPTVVREFKEGFRNIDFHKEVKRGTSIYNGVFNLLILRGAKDWYGGEAPSPDKLDDHHIVPLAWAKSLPNVAINSVLNRTPLTSETNRTIIRDRLPHQYLPELMATSGEAQVRAVLESHLISGQALGILLRPDFGPDDFEAFLEERKRTILSAIEDLLIKERLDLEPNLRALDADVEQVELALRRALAAAVDDDPAFTPEHFRAKVEDRIQRDLKRNPSWTAADFDRLSRRLEYFDLRELQDMIQAKTVWTHFEHTFGTREQLAGKFGQLANLRNGLKHARQVDPVTRMEGEAAILWFTDCLKRGAAAAQV